MPSQTPRFFPFRSGGLRAAPTAHAPKSWLAQTNRNQAARRRQADDQRFLFHRRVRTIQAKSKPSLVVDARLGWQATFSSLPRPHWCFCWPSQKNQLARRFDAPRRPSHSPTVNSLHEQRSCATTPVPPQSCRPFLGFMAPPPNHKPDAHRPSTEDAVRCRQHQNTYTAPDPTSRGGAAAPKKQHLVGDDDTDTARQQRGSPRVAPLDL